MSVLLMWCSPADRSCADLHDGRVQPPPPLSVPVTDPTPGLVLSPEVADALTTGRPVVALESTLLAHGLPRPDNRRAADDVEAAVRRGGAVPATIAVLDGVPHVGLLPEQGDRVCADPDLAKLSVRDLPVAAALRLSGATTVSSTSLLAARAGIEVFATGGLGGVHRHAAETFDESADLGALARTSVVVVCAGVKSILDVPATLERLESLSVTVVGYRTTAFPGFYVADSGSPLDWSVADPAEAAAVFAARRELSPGAVVVANPLPAGEQLDPALHDRVIADALAAADAAGVRGKAVTPFVLDHLHRASGGATLEVNVRLVLRNGALAGRSAAALRAGGACAPSWSSAPSPPTSSPCWTASPPPARTGRRRSAPAAGVPGRTSPSTWPGSASRCGWSPASGTTRPVP